MRKVLLSVFIPFKEINTNLEKLISYFSNREEIEVILIPLKEGLSYHKENPLIEVSEILGGEKTFQENLNQAVFLSQGEWIIVVSPFSKWLTEGKDILINTLREKREKSIIYINGLTRINPFQLINESRTLLNTEVLNYPEDSIFYKKENMKISSIFSFCLKKDSLLNENLILSEEGIVLSWQVIAKNLSFYKIAFPLFYLEKNKDLFDIDINNYLKSYLIAKDFIEKSPFKKNCEIQIYEIGFQCITKNLLKYIDNNRGKLNNSLIKDFLKEFHEVFYKLPSSLIHNLALYTEKKYSTYSDGLFEITTLYKYNVSYSFLFLSNKLTSLLQKPFSEESCYEFLISLKKISPLRVKLRSLLFTLKNSIIGCLKTFKVILNIFLTMIKILLNKV